AAQALTPRVRVPVLARRRARALVQARPPAPAPVRAQSRVLARVLVQARQPVPERLRVQAVPRRLLELVLYPFQCWRPHPPDHRRSRQNALPLTRATRFRASPEKKTLLHQGPPDATPKLH